MVVYLAQGELKHTRGDVISYFSSKQSLIDSNNGGEHFVKNIGKKTAILYIVAASAVGLPTTINNWKIYQYFYKCWFEINDINTFFEEKFST